MNNPFEVIDQRLARMEEMLVKSIQATKTADQSPVDDPTYVSRKTAAKLMDLCLNSIDKLIRENKIKAFRIGNNVRIRKRDIDSFFKEIKVN